MSLDKRESRQRKVENEAEISEESSTRLSRRDRKDDDDEFGSEDSYPELTEAVEHEHATRSRGKALKGGSGSRGSTAAAL
ncbi:hypothetical protein Taro_040388 [Colocasia esculenta]|uniref:Uncharacterized protein n=1 Tax=Colocasia esculenta TaxID=4460 RepID=A0A843WUF0_COLES|nr:hypothetical protein [Colocasia esculenta]